MIKNSCRLCKYSHLLKNFVGDGYKESGCEIYGIVPEKRAENCKDYKEQKDNTEIANFIDKAKKCGAVLCVTAFIKFAEDIYRKEELDNYQLPDSYEREIMPDPYREGEKLYPCFASGISIEGYEPVYVNPKGISFYMPSSGDRRPL